MDEAMDNGAAGSPLHEAADGDAARGGGSAGAAGSGGTDEVAQLRAALAQAEENLRQQREQYLRGAAELDNVRKRAQRDIDSAHRYALERFAGELLPVRDSLELGVRNGATSDPQGVLAGQEATLKLLERAFDKFSIKQIDPSGQRFDPSLHEAVLMQATSEAAPNSVLHVVQSGYELNGRLLRPARVVVAAAPAAGSGEGSGSR
jgi:molecular chaperone GrpE